MPALIRVAAIGVIWLWGATSAPAAKAKGPVIAPADVSAVVEKLEILTDDHGHYLVHQPYDADEHAYWGDGKSFYKIPVVGGGSEQGVRYDYVFWDPRHPQPLARQVDVKVGGAATITCGEKTTTMRILPAAEAKVMVAAAKFYQRRWTRLPHALARDDRGVYYFVDKERREGGKDHQLWSGPRGRLKRLKMTNIVEDPAGEIYASKKGSLRLILTADKASWVVGRRETKLTVVPIDDSGPLIYGDLGVYVGAELGTPCDAL